MAQDIRRRLWAQKEGATLYVVPAEDHVLNLPVGSNLTNAYVAEQIARVLNMNNTGRLPSIGMVRLGMIIRLSNAAEAPEAVISIRTSPVLLQSTRKVSPSSMPLWLKQNHLAPLTSLKSRMIQSKPFMAC